MNVSSKADSKVCIIGAGCSGFTMAKRLKDFAIPYDCFEASDDIGGNWYFDNPNGMSSCYKSLHIDTSKHRLAFEDFPVPKIWPDFPHHSQLLEYFHDYVDHFGLRDTITFNRSVMKCELLKGGSWSVHLSNGEEREYEALIVANGHHWDARIPDYPGHFEGYQIHSHNYRDPFSDFDFRGKRTMVVGAGNSAMDISSELSQRPVSEKLIISMRRGVWVLPKYLNGKPIDKEVLPAWIPYSIGKFLTRKKIKSITGDMESFGLPKPDHEPLNAHPSVSGEFLLRVGSGDITPKGAIERLDGDAVVFKDGTREELDAIIWATGYNINFPFLQIDAFTPAEDNKFPLFKRMVKPGFETLFFAGLAQALPTLVNLAEQQSKFVAAAISGRYHFPDIHEMERTIIADEIFHGGDYYDSPRHSMQIDFDKYVKDLKKEINRGQKRKAV